MMRLSAPRRKRNSDRYVYVIQHYWLEAGGITLGDYSHCTYVRVFDLPMTISHKLCKPTERHVAECVVQRQLCGRFVCTEHA